MMVDVNSAFKGIRWTIIKGLWDEEEGKDEYYAAHDGKHTVPPLPAKG
jgi:hypothetical protein